MLKLPMLLSLFILQSMFFSFANEVEYGPQFFNKDKQWTAIVAAFEPEIEAIDRAFSQIDEAKIDKIVTIKGVKYQLGTYKNEPIIIFTTGISISNAAMTMQMALDYFPIDKVVMMGIAGAVDPIFEPGDIVIPQRWYFHDESHYVNPDPEVPGKHILSEYYEQNLKIYKEREKTDIHAPKYKNFGFMYPREVALIRDGWDNPKKTPYFTVSPNLFALAKTALLNVDTIKMPSGEPIKIHIGGNGVTGSVFTDNAKYREWLSDVYAAKVTEMESAAVGQVCFVNDVDWIIMRSVSDLAGGQKGKNDISVFNAIASGTATKLMIGLLDEIVKADQKELTIH